MHLSIHPLTSIYPLTLIYLPNKPSSPLHRTIREVTFIDIPIFSGLFSKSMFYILLKLPFIFHDFLAPMVNGFPITFTLIIFILISYVLVLISDFTNTPFNKYSFFPYSKLSIPRLMNKHPYPIILIFFSLALIEGNSYCVIHFHFLFLWKLTISIPLPYPILSLSIIINLWVTTILTWPILIILEN